MHSIIEKLNLIKNNVNDIVSKKQLKTNPKIIVVSKTFPILNILPLLEHGHKHFGENKIQEAEEKWQSVKSNYKNLQLHMIGKLQSNKAKKAVLLFDFIHSLDNARLALKLSLYQKELNKSLKYFIQVNLAAEKQKSGIDLSDLSTFYRYCVKDLSLNVIGLMCLPPINSNSHQYFDQLKNVSQQLNLNDLSMGMSSDYEQAISNESTYIRIGTSILGKRTLK